MKLAAFSLCVGLLLAGAASAAPTCEGVTIITSPNFSGGAAARPGRIIINPNVVGRETPDVQTFIYHHECAHAQGLAYSPNPVADELKADKVAFERADKEGWMNPRVITEICLSLATEPRTRMGPSGKQRCDQLWSYWKARK